MASTATLSPLALPSGISNPMARISGDDQSGLVAIMTAFSLSLVFLSISIRTYVKNKMGSYRADDYAFILSCVFAIIQASAVFYEIRKGLGKPGNPSNTNDILPMEKAAYVSDMLYVVTLFLSKTSTAFLLLRLTPSRGHYIAIWATLFTTIVWATISIFLLAFRCHLNSPWADVTATCSSLFSRWLFIAILDITTEGALFAISIYLIWALQMSLKSKAIIVGAFGCRLPIIALAALHLLYLYATTSSTSTQPLPPSSSIPLSRAVTCAQLELGYAIMSSIMPCLKTFITAYECPTLPKQFRHYAYGEGSRGVPYKLESVTSGEHGAVIVSGRAENNAEGTGTKTVGVATVKTPQPVHLRQTPSHSEVTPFVDPLAAENSTYTASVVTRIKASSSKPDSHNQDSHHPRSQGGRGSFDSGESRRMIIKKGVEWSVAYESPVDGVVGGRNVRDGVST